MKKKLSKRQQRKRELKMLRDQEEVLLREERDKISRVRERRKHAEEKGNENRADELADKIEVLRAKLDDRRERIESLEARLGNVTAAIKRLRKRIKKAARRKKHYASKHFRYDEFDCRDGTPVPSYMRDDLRELCVHYLEPLRRKYGPARVNSGYRTRSYNAAIGGVSNSFHIYDYRKSQPAADVVFANGSPAHWAADARRIAAARGQGGVGQYNASNFVHIDTGPRRDWSG